MNFYTKVLSRHVLDGGLKVRIAIAVNPTNGITQARIDETRVALRELGLSEDIRIVSGELGSGQES
jgi:hypothetical protein